MISTGFFVGEATKYAHIQNALTVFNSNRLSGVSLFQVFSSDKIKTLLKHLADQHTLMLPSFCFDQV